MCVLRGSAACPAAPGHRGEVTEPDARRTCCSATRGKMADDEEGEDKNRREDATCRSPGSSERNLPDRVLSSPSAGPTAQKTSVDGLQLALPHASRPVQRPVTRLGQSAVAAVGCGKDSLARSLGEPAVKLLFAHADCGVADPASVVRTWALELASFCRAPLTLAFPTPARQSYSSRWIAQRASL